MQLEPKVANAIVDSLKDIIHHEINPGLFTSVLGT